ncbi:hypothetical protein O988_07127 [Pseudogymnoascus sp. VKM F-3808]|nr:hypothetical protein O988_07127 [Pseudogymnoascus sp. VKM F-3808]
MGRLLRLSAVWLGVISIVLALPADTSLTPAPNIASVAANQLGVPPEPALKTPDGTVIKVITDSDKPTIQQSFFYNVSNFNIKTRPWDALPTSADDKTLLKIRSKEAVLKKRREVESAPMSQPISRIKRRPLKKRADKYKFMVVGDSISQGMEGDWTWRYRLWEWLHNLPSDHRIDFEFVGPWTGTRQPPDAAPPPIPPTEGDPEPDKPPMVSGGYNKGVDTAFQSNHFALWGHQAAQSKNEIKKHMEDHQPTHLLVLLGFNDLGWFVDGPEGTLASMKSIVDNARAANPNIAIIIGDVVQRSALGMRADLPKITDQYNALLRAAIPKWNTKESPVSMAYVRDTYSCETQSCPSGHDGLHPTAMGEYQIARAFSVALFYGYGIGLNTLDIPSSVEGRKSTAPPTNIKSEDSPYGITITWDKVYGTRKYGVRSRYKGLPDWEESSTLTNRLDNTWVIKGSNYEYQIRIDNEIDGQSPWSATVDAIADPKTIRGPKVINTLPTLAGADVSWSPVEGAESYAVMFYDMDTPGSWLSTIMVKGLSYTWKSQTLGRRHVVAVQAWNSIGGGLPAVGRHVVPGADQVTAPDSLMIYSTDPTTIEILWCGNCFQSSYKLYVRSKNETGVGEWTSSGNEIVADAPTNVGSADVGLLFPGVWNFEFAVSGLNGDLESPMSYGLIPVHPPGKVGSGTCDNGVCFTIPKNPDPVPPTKPGTLPDSPVLGGPDRDLSDQICAMTWQSTGDPSPAKAAIISKTWADSRAGEYLHTFLETKVPATQGDWAVPFILNSDRPCSKPVLGGSNVDCSSILSGSCTIVDGPQCSDYCPPESMFIHASMVHFHTFYQQFHMGIFIDGLNTLAVTVDDISKTFAPVDTSIKTFFAVLGGVLGSMSSVAGFIGTGYSAAGNVGSALSVVSSLVSNTQLGASPDEDEAKELSKILGTTLRNVSMGLNKTISDVFKPADGKRNNALIESVFKNGAFLDVRTSTVATDAMVQAFHRTMDQYLMISAMKAYVHKMHEDVGYTILEDGDFGYDNEEDCTGVGNEALIWYKNRCIGFGTFTNLMPGGTKMVVTNFLDGGIITSMKKYVPDLRLAIINAYECYYGKPNRKTHETVFPPFDLTRTDPYPPGLSRSETALTDPGAPPHFRSISLQPQPPPPIQAVPKLAPVRMCM